MSAPAPLTSHVALGVDSRFWAPVCPFIEWEEKQYLLLRDHCEH